MGDMNPAKIKALRKSGGGDVNSAGNYTKPTMRKQNARAKQRRGNNG